MLVGPGGPPPAADRASLDSGTGSTPAFSIWARGCSGVFCQLAALAMWFLPMFKSNFAVTCVRLGGGPRSLPGAGFSPNCWHLALYSTVVLPTCFSSRLRSESGKARSCDCRAHWSWRCMSEASSAADTERPGGSSVRLSVQILALILSCLKCGWVTGRSATSSLYSSSGRSGGGLGSSLAGSTATDASTGFSC